MLRADSHVHFFRHGFGGRTTPEDHEIRTYEELRLRHSIAETLVVGYAGQDWCRDNNAYVATLLDHRPWMYPLAFIRADTPPSEASLRRLVSDGFVGASIYLLGAAEVGAMVAWSNRDVARLVNHLPLISINILSQHLPGAAQTLTRLSPARVLVSHLGMPGILGKELSHAGLAKRLAPVLELAEFPNVGVKISGLYATSEASEPDRQVTATSAVQLVRARFGAERLYWGSDYTPALQALAFDDIVNVARLDVFSEAELMAVMGGNLRTLLDDLRS